MPSAPVTVNKDSDTVHHEWSTKLAKKYIKALDQQQLYVPASVAF
jgi:hypothetical protein